MPCKSAKIIPTAANEQSGLVLFFALLALMMMSVAAVALIRSVDTNNVLTGNIVFRQSASTASNVAIEGVTETISKLIPVASGQLHQATLGYYANCMQFDTAPSAQICDGSKLTTVAWDNSNSRLVPSQTDGNDEIHEGKDRQGNEIRYIVERMCNFSEAEINAGSAATLSSRCMMASAASDGATCSRNQANLELFKQCTTSASAPLYRVTLRIAGPKNTVSFMQAFISN